MKKRHFTLIEILISLSLAAIILTVIFHFFSNLTTIEKNMTKAKEEILEKNYLQIKLNTIFSNLQYSKKTFFIKDNSLFCQFDNKIDPSALFCNVINAKLLIDSNNNLILETFPLKKEKSKRKEILKKNIKSLRFTVLEKKIKKEKFPIAISIIINDDLKFSFFLSSMQSIITY